MAFPRLSNDSSRSAASASSSSSPSSPSSLSSSSSLDLDLKMMEMTVPIAPREDDFNMSNKSFKAWMRSQCLRAKQPWSRAQPLPTTPATTTTTTTATKSAFATRG